MAARADRLDLRLQRLSRHLGRGTLQGASLKNGKLSISPVRADKNAAAEVLSDRIGALMPRMRITELLHEVARETGFLSAFTNVRTQQPVSDGNALLAVILADATNLGLSRMAEASHEVTSDQLFWTRDAFIRDETYKAALGRIVDAHHALPIAAVSGDGIIAASDGQFFRPGKRGAGAGQINARHGIEPGYCLYTHTSDQHGPIRSISMAAAALIGWLLVRAISKPLSTMTAAMKSLATGNLAIAIPAIGRKDEIGDMAGAVQVFKDAAVEKLRLEKEAEEQRRQYAEPERARIESGETEAARMQGFALESLATGLEHLSNGDLTYRLQDAFAAQYEKLRADFNKAIGALQVTVKAVATNTAAIRSGTTEISTATDDLSRRTEQQAASLEETAAALDEITATVKKTSDGSIHARTVVGSAKADAERSGTVVGQAVEAMSAIEQSAQQVSQIIGVNDEIAFQTNLLALNAGVEAARAGEAGRGFAVVASEVRALAQRSAEAAKEIKGLISTSSQQVSTGVDLVNETGAALKRIVTQVAEINAVVSDIAISTQEQATALQEVNTAINQMDQVTQQNAAMVEETTAASKSLAQETEELARLIGQFQLNTGSGARPSPVTSLKAKQTGTTAPALKTRGSGGAGRKQEAATQSWE